MAKFHKGIFKPINKNKCLNEYCIYRSSWELSYCNYLDKHPDVLSWGSEYIAIPYINPITRKGSRYIPDFIVTYLDKNKREFTEIIEIKPKTQTFLENAKSKKDKIAYIINQEKWKSAHEFSLKHGYIFRILTEKELFR